MLIEELKNKGFTAYITTEDPYRVQAGAFQTEGEARELEKELEARGFSVYIQN